LYEAAAAATATVGLCGISFHLAIHSPLALISPSLAAAAAAAVDVTDALYDAGDFVVVFRLG